jgi:hypothetical protein
VTLKTITSACMDTNEVPLVVRKCWLGLQETNQSMSNQSFSLIFRLQYFS